MAPGKAQPVRRTLSIPAMLSRSSLAASRTRLSISAHEMVDFELVLFDETLDVLAGRASLRAGISDRTAEAHVVADEIFS